MHDHQKALDTLNREMRRFTANTFRTELSPRQTDLVASLIEEEDFSASLGETLYQIARRVERQPFTPAGLEIMQAILDVVDRGIARHLGYGVVPAGPSAPLDINPMKAIEELRQRCLVANELPGEDRGALLALLGSAERALYLAERIQAERRSVSRELPQLDAVPNRGMILGRLSPEGREWPASTRSTLSCYSPRWPVRPPWRLRECCMHKRSMSSAHRRSKALALPSSTS